MRPTAHFAALILGFAWMCLNATGAETDLRRVGVLWQVNAPVEQVFRDSLRELGYELGKTISIDWRVTDTDNQKTRQLVRELIQEKCDVIVTGGTVMTREALAVTKQVPIVFVAGDPVGTGFAATLARPGGNATGVSSGPVDLVSKRLQLLHALVPQGKRLGYLRNPRNPAQEISLKELQRSSKELGLALQELNAGTSAELDKALASLSPKRLDAIYVSGDNLFFAERAKIAKAVREAKLPAVFPYSEWHDAGVLMSYGPSAKEMMRRMASFVDKILKGARPAELPVEQISQFDSVIDLRVARAMGIRVPEDVLLHADEVIR